MKSDSSNTFYTQYVSRTAQQVSPPLLYRLLKPFELHRHDAIEKLLPTRLTSLLDIGCGPGNFLIKNKERFTLAVGIDVVAELITEAQNLKIKNLQFKQHDAGTVPLTFRSNKFSAVVSIATLQYLYDLDLVFSEVHRVLEKDGLFIFEVPNFLVLWRRLQLICGVLPATSLFQEGWNGGVLHYFSEQKLTRFAEMKGFRVLKVKSSGIFSSLRSTYPSLLGANLIYVCQKK